MKKLLLAAVVSLLSFATFANNKVNVKNPFPPCATVTVQFVSYQEGSCTLDIYSPVYTLAPGGNIFDLSDPALWFPGVLWMPSYESYSAIVCVTCAGGTFCLPPIGIDMNPAHACDPLSQPSTPFAGCCFGSMGGDLLGGGGGGVCFTLNMHL